MKAHTIFRRGICLIGGVAAISLALVLHAGGADHRDGPRITDLNSGLAALDLNDLFVFRSPITPTNTVLILTVSPFAGVLTPDTFDTRVRYEIVIDQDIDETADYTLRATFDPAEKTGQKVTLTAWRAGRRTVTLASGLTGTNIPFGQGGMFRAANHDDPFFFDAIGFTRLAAGSSSTFPRESGQAANFFGPDVNTLALIIEIPTVELLETPDRPIIRAWTRTIDAKGRQVDRAGQPFLNQFLIPPLPRNDTTRGDLRDAFNLGTPATDVRRFRDDAIAVLTDFWGNPPDRAGALVDRFLMANVITFDTSLTWEPEGGGFPNGRRLRDDVADFMLSMLSNGRMKTDNVSDDNGDRITDGSMRVDGTLRPAAFPYLGPPNP
jgi:hypothetical protein